MSSSSNPRHEAAYILARVFREQAYANRLIDAAVRSKDWSASDRALLTELVYGVLRSLFTIDYIIDQIAKKGTRSIDPAIINHLRVAVYQILYLDRIPHYAVISLAVESIRQLRGPKVAGFANGLLRKLQRNLSQYQTPEPLPDPSADLSRRTSHPLWLVQMYTERLGQDRAIQRLETNNRPAPLTFRIHGSVAMRDQVISALCESGITATPTRWSPDGLNLRSNLNQPLHQLLQRFSVSLMPQDEAAQIISHWLQAEEGDQILDACAAPGGKTTHIAALSPKATITALDLHAHKLSLLQQLCHRLRIPVGYGTAPNPITDDDPHLGNSDTASYVRLMLADATQPLDAQYDRIICDAPCSGLGIIRKQPEIRYRRNQSDIQQCAKLQLQLLNNLARCLRSGGTLLYSVCTDTFEENEQIIEKFLCQNPSFRLDPAVPAQAAWGAMIGNDGFLRTSPEQHDLDAFFAARLTKL